MQPVGYWYKVDWSKDGIVEKGG